MEQTKINNKLNKYQKIVMKINN